MYYERTKRIEERFQRAFVLIWMHKVSLRVLAEKLGVSHPTAIRMVAELRRRGYKINVVRDSSGWHYEVTYAFGNILPPVPEGVKNVFPLNPDKSNVLSS
jgi:predicted DNA-binding transcriptional regulator YafY